MKNCNLVLLITLSLFCSTLSFAQTKSIKLNLVDQNGQTVVPGEGDILVGDKDGEFRLIQWDYVDDNEEPTTGICNSNLPEAEYGIVRICDTDQSTETEEDDCKNAHFTGLASALSLANINQLNPVIIDGSPKFNSKDQLFGLLGDQVSKNVPQVTYKTQNGGTGVYQDGMDALLVGAVQELTKQVNQKDAQIAALEKRLAKIEAKIK